MERMSSNENNMVRMTQKKTCGNEINNTCCKNEMTCGKNEINKTCVKNEIK